MKWRTRRCFCFCFCFVSRLLFLFFTLPLPRDIQISASTRKHRGNVMTRHHPNVKWQKKGEAHTKKENTSMTATLVTFKVTHGGPAAALKAFWSLRWSRLHRSLGVWPSFTRQTRRLASNDWRFTSTFGKKKPFEVPRWHEVNHESFRDAENQAERRAKVRIETISTPTI